VKELTRGLSEDGKLGKESLTEFEISQRVAQVALAEGHRRGELDIKVCKRFYGKGERRSLAKELGVTSA